MTATQAPPVPPRRRGRPSTPGRQPAGGPAAVGILAAMLLLGGLLVTNVFNLSEGVGVAGTGRAGCARVDRGSATRLTSPALARSRADLVVLATVESAVEARPIPEAAAPDSDWVTINYRIERPALRDTMDCRDRVEVTFPVERGRPVSIRDAPPPTTRVLLFVKPAVSGSFTYLTNAAPPVEAPQGARIYKVSKDPKSPPSETSAPPAPSLLAEVPQETPQDAFFTPGPRTEFPVRLTLTNPGPDPLDLEGLGPTQWRVSLKDAEGKSWTFATQIESGDLPESLDAGQAARVDLVTRPEGSSQLREGIYGLEAELATAGEPIAATLTTVAIDCVLHCPATG